VKTALIFLSLAASSAADWDWHQSLSPHFQVSHQEAWLPVGLLMDLERMHSRLRLDLAMFAPWISRERLRLFLYKDQASYLAGRFKPPPWSNGVALYEERVVAVFKQPDRQRLLEVVSHETTHLLFESYWGEAGKSPPTWLNEGLAMLAEKDGPQNPERSPWYAAMVSLLERPLGLEEFLRFNPAQEASPQDSRLQVWYVQAYSLVYFLLRQPILIVEVVNELERDPDPLPVALHALHVARGGPAGQRAWNAVWKLRTLRRSWSSETTNSGEPNSRTSAAASRSSM